MSASQIPNLLTSRGGPRSRGRGRGSGRGGAPPLSGPARRDQNVQATDTDAAVSRLSAVSMGYLEDGYAQYFVNGSGTRRLPIINRGTYARTTALDMLIDSFLYSDDTKIKQIVSLGAGTDTRYFRLRSRRQHRALLYHEIDFPKVCDTKRRIVKGAGQLKMGSEHIFENNKPDVPGSTAEEDHIGMEWGLAPSDGEPDQECYFCHPLDLRQLPSLPSLESIPGLRGDIPTLIISECCLCYLEIDTATDVIKWFRDKIPQLGIILYEPIGVDDAFGQMMVENLATRGIVMPTVQKYKSLSDQKARLAHLGFMREHQRGGSFGATIEEVWQKWIPKEERERVDALEGLDEVEEWQMLARHYSVVWGWTTSLDWKVQMQLLPAEQ